MRHGFLIGTFGVLLGGSLLIAQEGDKLTSGPKAGTFVPAPFESFNVNGPAKGRPHCLVCRFALSPAVLIFAKEPVEGKDDAFNSLVKKLDEAAADFEDRNFSVGVVILSPDARDSTNNVKEEDLKKLEEAAKNDPDELNKLLAARAKELVEETIKREKLYERLKKRAEPLKHAIVSAFPAEGPKKANINPKAEVTVLFYERLKVSDNWTFAPDELQEKDVDAIVKKVRDTLPLRKKVTKE